MSMITEIIDKAKEVKPIGEKNGKKIVTFDEAAALADKEMVDPTPKTGTRTYNHNGTLARTRKKAAAVNPNNYFANRYKVSKGKLKLVLDFRAIAEQSTGTVYSATIPVYVFARDEQKNLFIEKIENVSDTEFISDYTHTLTHDAMKQIAPLIAEYGSEVTASEIPI